MNKIPCFIISFNRLTFLKRQLEYLLKHPRLEVIIVDNCSTYQPLLTYIETLKMEDSNQRGIHVHSMDENYGHTVVWNMELSLFHARNTPYIVTDCDIIPDHVKHDYIDMMEMALNNYPQYNKVGLGLNTNNIPVGFPKRDEVINHETKVIHRKEIDSQIFFEAPVDTTFAMYRAGYHNASVWGTESQEWQGQCKSLRMKKPYEASHLGWHITKKTEEDEYYFKSCLPTVGHWKW